MAKNKNLSIDMYHRIYRLAIRKIPADQIAITLDLPLNVVRNVVDQFFNPKRISKANARKAQEEENRSYLDIYTLQRMRITLMDINGMLTKEHISYLSDELTILLSSRYKAIALLMANVKEIDDTGFSYIMNFYEQFLARGRYTAILDPSKATENYLQENNLEGKIPVFGTEKAFEENALQKKKEK